MNKLAETCIKRIYREKDYQYFKKRCKQTPEYLGDLVQLADTICDNSKIYSSKDDPSIEIWFEFENYIEGKFNVEYRTLLKISKLADVFVFQHEFAIENRDPGRMTPVLDGYSGEPYIILQSKLENVVEIFLKEHNLQKLQLFEMDEVIEGIKIPEKSIFGSQMTLENALFRDLYEICD